MGDWLAFLDILNFQYHHFQVSFLFFFWCVFFGGVSNYVCGISGYKTTATTHNEKQWDTKQKPDFWNLKTLQIFSDLQGNDFFQRWIWAFVQGIIQSFATMRFGKKRQIWNQETNTLRFGHPMTASVASCLCNNMVFLERWTMATSTRCCLVGEDVWCGIQQAECWSVSVSEGRVTEIFR